MTEKQLRQYRSLKREVQELQDEINSYKVHDVVKASNLNFPYTQGTAHVYGLPLTTEVKRLHSRKGKCIKECQEIKEFVDNIEDSEMRRIFKYRYIMGSRRESWQKIADYIGEQDEQYPRRIHNKFIKNIKLDENDEKAML